jgi:hypothetical protein
MEVIASVNLKIGLTLRRTLIDFIGIVAEPTMYLAKLKSSPS